MDRAWRVRNGVIFSPMVAPLLFSPDPRTWPWALDVWLAFVLLSFAGPIWRWFLRRRSETWPSTQGRIDSTAISGNKFSFRNPRSTTAVTASLTYSYQVNDKKYAGTYTKEFGTIEESEDFLRDLEGKALTVQYSPADPSRSAVLGSSIMTLLSSRGQSEVSALETHQYLNPLPLWLTRVIPLFEILAIIAFALSACVNLGALTSQWTPPRYFWALHVGIFVVFTPAIVVAQKRVGDTKRKDFWKVVLAGAPDWMRYTLYGLFAYGAVVSFPSWFRLFQQMSNPGTSSRGLDLWLVFSSAWMVFYWGSFAVLHAAMQQERQRPRCVNGHPIPPGAALCTQCGQPIVRT